MATSLDEPPDRSTLPRPILMQSTQNNAMPPLRSLSSSLADQSTSPTVPYSPYMADSTGGSASDYEHECDSPSSLSSWNSWAGGRRGDLADVEDLELDGILGGVEPELETVSELDEESSGFFSGSDRLALDSDDDLVRSNQSDKLSNLDLNGARRKSVRAGGQFNDVSQNYHVHHAYNQHQYHHYPTTSHQSHAPPSFPHFSPRAGGHGLSHASRYALRAPPNLAARRRKGRIAELAEEGGAGDGINTTVMPQPGSLRKEGADANSEALQTETETETNNDDNRDDLVSPSTPTIHSVNHGWSDFEFVGPPALPVRCISPSETIPVVPSPLSVCLTAEEQSAADERGFALASSPSKSDTAATPIDKSDETINASRPSSPPSPTTSGKSVESFPATISTPSTSPPTSPLLVRKGSRNRRSSSPGKVLLRPCFRRRASAQVGNKRVDSSSDHDSNGEASSSRGRGKVRFSTAPPVEVRTHSPVDYDRKACPISNRLSPSDVEELRDMKMEMGLLEAKMAAMAACKAEVNTEDEESESESHSNRLVVPTVPFVPAAERDHPERRRADSISSSSPSRFCKIRFYGRDTSISPADHLRIEREKERERACRMAGIGTGIGFRYSASGTTPRQLHHGGSKTPGACNPASIISRFGLSKPPPPLPGCTSPTRPTYEGGTSLHRPSSAPPIRSESTPSISTVEHAMYEPDDVLVRGRPLLKGAYIRSTNDSASTDGTITGSTSRSTSVSIPEVIHTSPSPETSPERRSNRSVSPPLMGEEKIIRPNILPHQPQYEPQYQQSVQQTHSQQQPSFYSQHSSFGSKHTSPSPPSSTRSIPTTHNSPCGYDSPASEFYESGSEYDLIG